MSGEGAVQADNGGIWEIFACNLPGHKTWFAETACVYLNADDKVKFTYQIDFNNYHIKVITPGILDTDKWDGLDQNKLAFRCDDSGDLVTGIYAP